MKRSHLWSAGITILASIPMAGAFSIIGPTINRESRLSAAGAEHRTGNDGAKASIFATDRRQAPTAGTASVLKHSLS